MTGDQHVSDRLRDLEVALATLSATLTTKIDELTRTLGPQHAEHELRLRVLETDLAAIKVRVALVASAIGTAAGGLAAVIVHLLGGPA